MSSEELNILYQDEWLVVIDKPAGYLVHPAREPQEGDLVAMKILRDQIGKRVYTIHRLDRPTSGVLLLGTDKEVAHALHKALEFHHFDKSYWAVVNSELPSQELECREPLQKEEGAPLKEAHTSFRVLEQRRVGALEKTDQTILSLVEAVPHTGRFHQIRRHLLHCGAPIVGDYRYAGIERSDELGDLLGTSTRMLLQARSLTITHPVLQQEITFTAPIDENFKKCFPSI